MKFCCICPPQKQCISEKVWIQICKLVVCRPSYPRKMFCFDLLYFFFFNVRLIAIILKIELQDFPGGAVG